MYKNVSLWPAISKAFNPSFIFSIVVNLNLDIWCSTASLLSYYQINDVTVGIQFLFCLDYGIAYVNNLQWGIVFFFAEIHEDSFCYFSVASAPETKFFYLDWIFESWHWHDIFGVGRLWELIFFGYMRSFWSLSFWFFGWFA